MLVVTISYFTVKLNLQNTNVEYIFVANINNLYGTCNANILDYRQNHIVCLISDESFGIQGHYGFFVALKKDIVRQLKEGAICRRIDKCVVYAICASKSDVRHWSIVSGDVRLRYY